MKTLRLIAMAAVCLGVSAPAFAQGGFLDFMEQWSGPGPFNYGISLDARLGCFLMGTHNRQELEDVRQRRIERRVAKGAEKAFAQQQEDQRKTRIKDEDERLFGWWFHRDMQMVDG